jgi:hypothetical protein
MEKEGRIERKCEMELKCILCLVVWWVRGV